MTLTMNYHYFPELVCKTKKKKPFYIDDMLKAPRGKFAHCSQTVYQLYL